MTEASKPKKVWLLPTLALTVIAGSWLVFRLMFPPFAPPVLPVPNGYDDLLRAAKMLAPRTGFYDEMDKEELTAIVQQNEPAINLAREALQKECMVTVDWSADKTGLETHLENSSSLRSLGRAFAAAARHAKSSGVMDEAVQCGLDTIELAQAAAPGGLAIDRMLAGGVHYTAMYSLREQVEQLSRDDCLRLQKKLQASPLQFDEISELIRRDIAFTRHTHGRLQTMMMMGAIRAQSQQTIDAMLRADKQHAVLNTILQAHLALRAFQLDNNRLPEKLDELLPEYLDKMPQDSFADEPLIYRPQSDGYLLYSVGPDGVDDNGAEQQSGSQNGDLLLELED